MARAWSLVSRPVGLPTLDNFDLLQFPDLELQEGQLRVQNTWMSVDPYMRARMNDIKYAPCYQLGQPMYGSAVGVVIESRNRNFNVGDKVYHSEGWRDVSVVDPINGAVREGVPPFVLPDVGVEEQAWLHNLGIPGGTGWFALMRTAQAKAGDIVFVSAAAGAVGSAVVQVAKAKGMTVIASAGGAEKGAFLRKLGADAVIDYKAGPILPALQAAAPDGIDVYFDNVGGDHLNAALICARPYARFALCGMIANYNEDKPLVFDLPRKFIHACVRMEGMYFGHHAERELNVFQDDMAALIRAGKVRSYETVFDGIEQAPQAFLGLFSGQNTGKMLVRF